MTALPAIPPDAPVLIAGPTASGKSALALEIADRFGGVVVNADASQIYGCWRVVTARPDSDEEYRVAHRLYGHVDWRRPYSAGDWLRAVRPMLGGARRPIIVGGTGLYFQMLTAGMARIPPTPPDIRRQGDALRLPDLIAALDADTLARIDLANRARVQRAWEVQSATGRGLAAWQADTPPPALDLNASIPLVLDAPKDWLTARINRRFDAMLSAGAMEEVAAMQSHFDPALPAFRAIGVPELLACQTGALTVDAAREKATIATRQFAKRQRTWFRSKMQSWHAIDPTGKSPFIAPVSRRGRF